MENKQDFGNINWLLMNLFFPCFPFNVLQSGHHPFTCLSEPVDLSWFIQFSSEFKAKWLSVPCNCVHNMFIICKNLYSLFHLKHCGRMLVQSTDPEKQDETYWKIIKNRRAFISTPSKTQQLFGQRCISWVLAVVSSGRQTPGTDTGV